MDHQIPDLGIVDRKLQIDDLVKPFKNPVLLFPVEAENGGCAVKDGEDLPVSRLLFDHLPGQHKTDDDPVAGRSGKIYGLVQHGRREKDNVIGNHVVALALYKVVSLRA